MVERKHRHLLEVAKAHKHQANIPIKFWGDCVITATYPINLMPTRVLSGITPYERLFGKTPDTTHLRVFNCLCYSAVISSRDKFGPRATKCIFMGYLMLQKAIVYMIQ